MMQARIFKRVLVVLMRSDGGIFCQRMAAGRLMVIYRIMSLIEVVIVVVIMRWRLGSIGGIWQTCVRGRCARSIVKASRRSLINSIIARLLLFMQGRVRGSKFVGMPHPERVEDAAVSLQECLHS